MCGTVRVRVRNESKVEREGERREKSKSRAVCLQPEAFKFSKSVVGLVELGERGW